MKLVPSLILLIVFWNPTQSHIQFLHQKKGVNSRYREGMNRMVMGITKILKKEKKKKKKYCSADTSDGWG